MSYQKRIQLPRKSQYKFMTAGSFATVLLTALLTLLIAAGLEAATITEYDTPLTSSSTPIGITKGPDGNVWFVEYYGNKVGKITPSGVITEYTLPMANSTPMGITTGPDGNLWFTENDGNNIGKITTAGVITEYPLPSKFHRATSITSGPDGNLWFTAPGLGKIGKITTAGVVTVYSLPVSTSWPNDITTGPDGNLWFTERQNSKIGKITTAGVITEYAIPATLAYPNGITVGADNNLWFADYQNNAIWKLTTSGVFTKYSLPNAGYLSMPQGIALGPDGNLWFAERDSNKIGKITTTGTVTEYTIPTLNSEPMGITAGADGNIWFTEKKSNKIGKIITASATEKTGDTTAVIFAEYPVTNSGGAPYAIAKGPDGNTWFVQTNGNKIGKISSAGAITEYTIPSSETFPWGIALGPDGNLWFTESDVAQIGKITPTGVITEYPIPGVVHDSTSQIWPNGITAGPDGNMWFTESGASRIGKITPTGVITEYNLPTTGLWPNGITLGPDGNLWFTESYGNKIGKITPTGTVTEFSSTKSGNIDDYQIAAGSYPTGITLGPDGNLWFTEMAANKIGKMTTSGIITEYDLPQGGYPWGITAGPDGNLWFVESGGDNTQPGGNNIGRITTAGVITEYPIPTAQSWPTNIALGPDNNLWFTEYGTNKIGKLVIGTAKPTTTTVSSSLSPSTYGQSVTLTAKVTGTSPTGTVTFKYDWKKIGTATLDANGQAAFTTTTLATGDHFVSAIYGGDAVNDASTSPNIVQTVNSGQTGTITVSKTGQGTVISYQTGINCGSTCSAGFTDGTYVILTATPASGYDVSGWSGCDYSQLGICGVLVSSSKGDRPVTAAFTNTDYQYAAAYINYYGALYSTFFGSASGDITSGTDTSGTYYVQWYTNGTALLAWPNGYLYFYYSGAWYSLGVQWRTDLSKASAAINSFYLTNYTFFSYPTGSITSGTDVSGMYFIQWYYNGTAILAMSDGKLYYYYSGAWYSASITWK
ncbi:virginiamycin B lyase family protein [Candidatus Magnetominusculus xianensis]|uniref:Virginiamycin B lyase n=1 Tax=Candidatus Magnetominusculus xianensis TaxID=1748249 RepID=A0ABR5SID1_9BACT|nr:Ig-like domain repeat protein [Candidatus Magnetominusculus xianensis]KWT92182.1 virginiamycin B lyase [Candidatus Magnetominusculus xianensis]MBF0404647.1 SMP-30/gluconolactonase/LRE family protein [Nitrospirota bacterium]